MSASDKKKLRKEQNNEAMSKKQAAKEKEDKQLRAYTFAFIAILCVFFVFAAWMMISNSIKNSGSAERNTVALTLDGNKISSAELSYYYVDAINDFYSNMSKQYGSAASLYAQLFYNLDMTKPLNEQTSPSGKTWAEYFLDKGVTSAKDTYALSNAATASGVTLSEKSRKEVDDTISTMAYYATANGFQSTTAYLKAMYGNGANEAEFRDYLERVALAYQYYEEHQDSLKYDDAALRAEEKDNFGHYSSFTGNIYWVANSNYLEGGTKDDQGRVTYSDEQKDAAAEKAEKDAKTLSSGTYADDKALDAAIAALEINAGKENASSTPIENTLYSSLNTVVRDWFADSGRKVGEVAAIPAETTDSDGNKTISGYYVVYFRGSRDNNLPMANVRHLLVAFSGGTTDENGVTVYSEEEKKEAFNKANDYLKEWKSGPMTSESFAALATEHTDDSGSKSNGGLYTDINPDSKYVAPFLNWCMEEGRKPGDTDIIETEYGYHVMYYVEDSELSYRDYLITNTLINRDQENWYNAIVSPVTVELKDTSLLKMDLVIKRAG